MVQDLVVVVSPNECQIGWFKPQKGVAAAGGSAVDCWRSTTGSSRVDHPQRNEMDSVVRD